ncbi:MAG: 30S ribosomal protein S6 [Erysipelotrichaceae bacterium]|nr:30S ribosomal protein S6 [Erysipelotrichaceae bacterium]
MKQYETMYIIKSGLDDAARNALIEEMHGIITNHGGSIDNVDDWGMKDFAYEIDGMTKGYYVVVTYTVDVEGLNEFNRLMRINGDVVRLLTISEDEKKSGK